jgi:hypothetical protein
MKTSDPLFVADSERNTYAPITPGLFRTIVAGGVRL